MIDASKSRPRPTPRPMSFEDRQMRVSIYDLRGTKGRNTGVHVTLGEWPVRVCKHRGFTQDRLVLQRDATSAEAAEARSHSRLACWRYDSIDALVDDETAAGVDPAIIEAVVHRLTRRSAP